MRPLYAVAALVAAALPAVPPLAAQQTDTMPFHRAAEYSQAERGDAVLVMVDGRVVYEAYHNRGKADAPHVLHSGTKSFAGILAVAAQQDALLVLDEPAATTLTEWQRDPAKRDITIRQLLTLTSGLEAGRIGRPPSYAAAITAPTVSAPGEVFDYGPNPFQAFGELLKRKLASRGETVGDYLRRRILAPLGIAPGEWPGLEKGEPELPSGAELTARDWAKFGELVRQQGQWQGSQLLPSETLVELFKGSRVNPAYGVTFWLNVPVTQQLEEEVRLLAMNFQGVDEIPGLEGMVVAAGAFKQRLYIIPSQRMVVVRFGHSGNRHFSDAAFLRLLTGAEAPPPPRGRRWWRRLWPGG